MGPEAVIQKRGSWGFKVLSRAGLRLSWELGKGTGAVVEAKRWWHDTYTTVPLLKAASEQ